MGRANIFPKPIGRMMMKRLIKLVQQASQRQRTRKQLLELTPEQLKDIAVAAEDAAREGRKRFWQ